MLLLLLRCHRQAWCGKFERPLHSVVSDVIFDRKVMSQLLITKLSQTVVLREIIGYDRAVCRSQQRGLSTTIAHLIEFDQNSTDEEYAANNEIEEAQATLELTFDYSFL